MKNTAWKRILFGTSAAAGLTAGAFLWIRKKKHNSVPEQTLNKEPDLDSETDGKNHSVDAEDMEDSEESRRAECTSDDMPAHMPFADPIYRDTLKRGLDIAICAPALVVAALPMAVTALAVKLDSPGPVLFRQKRLGYHGEEFEMLKFRSMKVNAEHTGSGVYSNADDDRVTRVGKFIRATSLDELPQLINILRGDMSLIGPRPPLTYHPWPIDEYTDEQRRMFNVRPGITGWAQTHGRKDVEWHHRIQLNVWYVDHVTFALDVKIFFDTIFKVLSNKDNVNKGETLQTADPAADPSSAEEHEEADNKAENFEDIFEETEE